MGPSVVESLMRLIPALRRPWSSVSFLDEMAPFKRRLIVVAALLRPLRQLGLRPVDLLVRNLRQDMRNDVQAGTLLVVGTHDVPGSVLGVSVLEHHVARP